MKKPTAKKREALLDYLEMVDFINKKYGIDTRDYADKKGREKEWTESTGINLYAAPQSYDGKHYAWIGGKEPRVKVTKKVYDEEFQVYYANCKAYSDWNKEQGELPYLDYWHWLTDKCFYEVRNGSSSWFPIVDILENKDNPEWVLEITQLFHDEFKDDLDKDGGIEVMMEW
jgi:hypothetical protein